MNKIKFYLPIIVLILAFSSCKDYLDINDDPYRVQEVKFENLLPTVIERTAQAHYSISRSSSLVTQQIGYSGYPKKVSASGAWSTIYLHVFTNCRELIDKAQEKESPHYAGIGQVLMAINLGLLTDNWEQVPFKEALKNTDNLTPSFDSQESLYKDINSLLDEAIANLSKEESKIKVGKGDMIFQGDIEKWLKVANTLKARYSIHLYKKNIDANSILDNYIDNGMSDNSDDLQLFYNNININPWNVIVKNNATGNISVTFGGYLIHLLKANNDPRLYAIVDTTGLNGAEPFGVSTSDAPYGDPTGNVDFEENTWLSGETSPNQVVTYAESKFIEAELAFIAGQKERAYNAYLAGITANIEKIGVDGSEYLANPNVAVGAGNLTLSHIMKEKYVATYLMPETWVDMRRYQYDNSIYPDFIIPDPDTLNQGAIQRFEFPDFELSRNEEQVKKAIKDNSELMWRDK